MPRRGRTGTAICHLLIVAALALCIAGSAAAQTPPPAITSPPDALPPPVAAALARAHLPPEALTAYVVELGPRNGAAVAPRLAHRAWQPVNPASLMKLYTTGAALELLGPAWTWSTPVLAAGAIDNGVLHGDLVLQGRGDPSLTLERLWLLLRQVQQRGIAEVRGDIVLDASAIGPLPGSAADFDGEPLKPYNVRPDALLLNLKALTLSFVPEPGSGSARVIVDTPLAGVTVDARVPLAAGGCGDWRGSIKADFSDPARLRFAGSYPAACGERSWPIAYGDPASYNARLVEALWRELGGRLGGRVRNAATPAGAVLLFESVSPPLAAVVRDINKFSNNVMAEQLFLSLALAQAGAGRTISAAIAAQAAEVPPTSAPPLAAASTPSAASAPAPTSAPASAPEPASQDGPAPESPGENGASAASATAAEPAAVAPSNVEPQALPPLLMAPRLPDAQQLARELLVSQVRLRTGCGDAELLVDNGSGLSRSTRTSARCLGLWLQALWTSPVMPELMSSLPVSGIDGTARRPGRAWGPALGRAHLKTGSLREVAGVAGYVLALSGRRYAVVAIVNDPQAGASRPVLDALVQWAVEDAER